jgi:hypothetical protein
MIQIIYNSSSDRWRDTLTNMLSKISQWTNILINIIMTQIVTYKTYYQTVGLKKYFTIYRTNITFEYLINAAYILIKLMTIKYCADETF